MWLAREQPGRAAAAAAMVLAAVALARALTNQPWAALLTFAFLGLALRDFAFPVRFTLTERYAEFRGLGLCHRIEWPRVRSVYRDARGLKLSPLARPSRLEAYRGVYLWVPRERADHILAAVQALATERQRP